VELRRRLSLVFFERLLTESLPTYDALTEEERPQQIDLPHALAVEELYDLRRDVCGVPPGQVVRHVAPADIMHVAGAVHLMLQKRRSGFIGARYVGPNDSRVRIVNGAGQVLSLVKRKFSTGQSNKAGKDIVICASTENDGGAQTNIVRGDQPLGIVRLGPEADWVTLGTARTMGLC
jgi:hypothetical protein